MIQQESIRIFPEFEKFPDEQDETIKEYQDIFQNLKNSQTNRIKIVSPLKHFRGKDLLLNGFSN
jgi:hypothetical protein